MNKKISDSLDMRPLEDYEIVEAPIVSDHESDYEYARQNFYNVIEKGTQALEQMLNVAQVSEHPRAYEVVSTIMKTLIDANKDLVEMGNKQQKEKKPEEPNVTNNLFVGSTSELQQLLKDLRNDK